MAIIHGTNSGDLLGDRLNDGDQVFGWDASNAPGDEGPVGDNDTLVAGDLDALHGGAGDDALLATSFTSEARQASLFGGAGDDRLEALLGRSDHLEGGDGIDLWVVYSQPDRVTPYVFRVADLQSGVIFGGNRGNPGTIVMGIERIQINGSDSGDWISGGDYADTIYGNGGTDHVVGGAGNDVLNADGPGRGATIGSDQVFGGAGDDTVGAYALNPNLVLRGGAGVDVLDYGVSDGLDVVLQLSRVMTFANGTTATGFERLTFSAGSGNDSVTGGDLGDSLYGVGGNDALYGAGGDDYLQDFAVATDVQLLDGGRGDDTVEAVLADGIHLIGGSGHDLLILSLHSARAGVALSVDDMAGGVTLPGGAVIEGFEHAQIDGHSFNDSLTGGAGHDWLNGAFGDDVLRGGDGRDALIGKAGEDTLYGGNGDDRLVDRGGANVFAGGAGDDTIVAGAGKRSFAYGGAGDDDMFAGHRGTNLTGGAGSDSLHGGLGADQFNFNSGPVMGEVDVIFAGDFDLDSIVLIALAFDGLSVGDLAAGQFVAGTVAMDGNDRIIYDQATGQVWYDADGAGARAAVHFLTLDGSPDLTFADFSVV